MAVEINGMSPYVHSNIYNFMMTTSTLLNEMRSSEEFDALIAQYQSWIYQLNNYEQELYSYCRVSDYQELNRKLFGEGLLSHRFTDLAQAVMLDTHFISQLIPKIDKNTAFLIFSHVKGRTKTLVNELFKNTDEIDITQTRRALVEAIRNYFQNESTTIFGKEEFNKVFKGFSSDIKRAVDIASNNRQSNIQKTATKLILQVLKDKNLSISKETFCSAFIATFKSKMINRNIVVPLANNDDLEKIIRNLSIEMYNALTQNGQNSLYTYISNLLGQRGEGMLEFAINNISSNSMNLDITVESIGNLTEKDVYENYFKELGFSEEEAMLKVHDITKFSGTDNLIKIVGPNGVTKIFRVQSKDSLLRQLENPKAAQALQVVNMISNQSVKETLQKLNDKNIISAEEENTLAYVIANLVWFQTKGSYRDRSNRAAKVTQSTGSSNVSSGINYINTIFSTHIKDFIGMTVIESAPLQLQLSATNIFYFLGSRTLFPVSKVLEQVVDQLKNFKHELFSVKYILNNSSANFAYTSAKAFFAEKAKHFTSDFYNSEVMNVGYEQGEKIMSSVMGHLNFNFNIAEILKMSSYVF